MRIKKLHLLLILILFQFQLFAQVDPYSPDPNPPAVLPGYKLSWSDEFNYTGKPSSANWSYETGFVRNEEHQWYQSDNANVSNGTLQITGRRERVKNPNYQYYDLILTLIYNIRLNIYQSILLMSSNKRLHQF